jgi:hypothetical protein
MIIDINKEYSKMVRLSQRFMKLKMKNDKQYKQSHDSEVSKTTRVIKREMADVSQLVHQMSTKFSSMSSYIHNLERNAI